MSEHRQPTPASTATAAINRNAVRALPFDSDPAQEDVLRGFITAPETVRVQREGGGTTWSLEPYDFLDGDCPDEVHPSLWRISQLNRTPGLFEVCEGIYQVRGYDISNMSILSTDNGYLIVDPLTTVESAAAATRLALDELGERPLSGILFTHSHVDHFGGVRGVLDVFGIEDPSTVTVIAPAEFMAETVSENVYAGNAMLRRAMYMFGPLLPRGTRGQVSAGLGVTSAGGTTSLLTPTHTVAESGTTITVDGLELVFQYTPNTEAPAELIFHVPSRRALCMAEIVSHVMHNLYTLRGAQVRDALGWSKCLYEAIERFSAESDVMFISHHWPVWGQQRVVEFIQQQGDMYKYLHDQTLRLANHGHGPEEIAERLELPDSLSQFWPNRGLYGSVSHNSRAVYQRYLGWFDGHPSSLNRHTPTELGKRYVAAIGGPESLLAQAQQAFDDADYRWACELLRHLIAAEPTHAAGVALQAETFDQLGYQAESGPWRNIYLSGAQELRTGVPGMRRGRKRALDEVRAAMPVEMILDYLGIRLNGPRADGKNIELRVHITDDGRTYVLYLRNSVLSFVADRSSTAPEIAVSRLGLLRIVDGVSDADDELDDTTDRQARDALAEILDVLDEFDNRFPIVTDRAGLQA
ncbi:MAG: alkyl/aryl-sulfatase [Cumulibacter sp.]